MGIFKDLGVNAEHRPAHVRLPLRGRRRHDQRADRDARAFRPGDLPAGRRVADRRNCSAHAQVGIADIIFGYNYIDEAGHEGGPKSQCWAAYAAVAGTGQSVTCIGASGFYFGNNPLNTTGSGASPFVTHESGSSITRGLFTHIKWQFLPWFRLETGARYTKDRKDFFNVEGSVTPTNDFRGFTWVLNDDTVDLFGAGSTEFSKTTPTVSLNFMTPEPVGFVDDGLLYLLWSRGFQSGGFNTELEVARIPQLAPLAGVQARTLDNYEIGIKTTLFDRRLRLNLALFQMRYKDKQEAINIDNANGEFGPNTAIEVIQNAAKAKIEGYELEFQALLGAGFSIDGGLAKQKPTYTDYNVFDPETGEPGRPDRHAAQHAAGEHLHRQRQLGENLHQQLGAVGARRPVLAGRDRYRHHDGGADCRRRADAVPPEELHDVQRARRLDRSERSLDLRAVGSAT